MTQRIRTKATQELTDILTEAAQRNINKTRAERRKSEQQAASVALGRMLEADPDVDPEISKISQQQFESLLSAVAPGTKEALRKELTRRWLLSNEIIGKED